MSGLRAAEPFRDGLSLNVNTVRFCLTFAQARNVASADNTRRRFGPILGNGPVRVLPRGAPERMRLFH